MKRVLLASLLGGIAMFAWTSIAHMVLPLGTIGIQEIPNEAAVLGAMQASMGTAEGMYLYPGMGLGPNPTMEQMRAAMPDYEKKLATSPSGILIYHPPGATGMTGRRLGVEFGNEFILCLLAVCLLSATSLSRYGPRVVFVAGVGVVAALATNISYWNWYGFPGSYTATYAFVEFMGFVAAGLVAAAVLGRGKAASVVA